MSFPSPYFEYSSLSRSWESSPSPVQKDSLSRKFGLTLGSLLWFTEGWHSAPSPTLTVCFIGAGFLLRGSSVRCVCYKDSWL